MNRGRLVDEDTGVQFEVGDHLRDSDGKMWEITGWQEPHKPSSSGRVNVTLLDTSVQRSFFPHVFGLKIVDFN